MTNLSKKGYKKEKLCRDELKKEGWRIVFKSVRFKFGTIDFATLFDVVSYRGLNRRYISCKHFGKSNYYLDHQKDIKKFKDEFGLVGESYELWLWSSPRWKGRGDKKIWENGYFIKVVIE